MKPHGIIYQAGKSSPKGQTRLRIGIGKRILYHTLRGFGAGLSAFAILALIFTFWPIAKEEFLYRFGTHEQAQISKFSSILDRSLASELGLDPNFSIYIPKIGAKAKVIANVDPGSPSAYLKALTNGVAHAMGTNFPGQGKSIYIFSHSTDSPLNIDRYNAVFYLLRKLSPGDRVIIYFMDQEHVYVVTDKFVTSPEDTSWLSDDGNGLPAQAGERLILQTCDPPGTSWNRLIVVAKPI